jgi:hypothetical protein
MARFITGNTGTKHKGWQQPMQTVRPETKRIGVDNIAVEPTN